MQTLLKMYRPITGTPFKNNDSYREILPCDALAPYIRCFWGTKKPAAKKGFADIVIPDTCMDIIFRANYSQNKLSGVFCAIDESSSISQSDAESDITAIFGIRFYAWTAVLFSDGNFSDFTGSRFCIEEFSRKIRAALEPVLFDIPDLAGKISAAEKLLLETLCTSRINADLMNGIYYMLSTSGRAKISDICGYTAVSEKQLQRIFKSNVGISPKTFSSLVRYQLLWQEAVFSKSFSALDAVEKYGYTDQSHMLRDFKRRHLMTITEALEFADKNR